MSALETAGIFAGIPLLVILFFASVTLPRKSPHPATYNMNDGWTHGPILWAAVDETLGGHGGHGHGNGHGHVGADLIGGSSSGKW